VCGRTSIHGFASAFAANYVCAVRSTARFIQALF
jgi:hypothetical protein